MGTIDLGEHSNYGTSIAVVCTICSKPATIDSRLYFGSTTIICESCRSALHTMIQVYKGVVPPNPFKGLNEMAMVIYEGNAERGFWDKERNIGETLMLVVTELAEALEAHRKGKIADPEGSPAPTPEQFEEQYKDTFEDEIADTMIRLLDLCGGWNIDLDFHIREKVKYNSTRGRLHGKQY